MEKDEGCVEIRPGVWAGPAPDLSMTPQERAEVEETKRAMRTEKALAISGVSFILLAMLTVVTSLIFNISGPVIVPLIMFLVGDISLIVLCHKKEAREKKLKEEIASILGGQDGKR